MKNIKRFLGLFLVFVMLVSAVPFFGSADSAAVIIAGAITSNVCGKNLTWKLDQSTGILTISGTGSMYYYSISQGAIYQITPPWYENRGSVKKIVIGDGVTEIGAYAFYGCSKAQSVEIAASVKKIGNKAFSYCNTLSELVFTGDGLEEIGEYAFENCNALSHANLPETVRTISDGAFFSCDTLESVNLPNTLETLGKKAFYSCEALTSVTVPGKVRTIGDKTFYECYKLSSLTLSEGLTEIGEEAFRKCNGIEAVTLPESLQILGQKVFFGCVSLEKVNIPAGVKTIGAGAFNSCGKLASLTLSDGIETIEKEAFAGCAIENLTLPKTLKTLGDASFMNCTNLSRIENNANIDRFGVIVFYGTKWLDEYPDDVIYLGNVLYGVKSGFADSVLTVKDGTRLLADSALNNQTAVSEVILPTSVERLGKYVFYNCTALQSVSLSKNVLSVGQKAFEGCEALTDIAVFNPDCEIYDAADTLPESTVITSFEQSTAQKYAETYSRTFNVHVHTFAEVADKPATCTEDGERTESCLCGETVITAEPATGHIDKDGDGVCDVCGEDLGTHTPSENCSCNCHKSGFAGFIYKIMRFFWKLFGINKVCACGQAHY